MSTSIARRVVGWTATGLELVVAGAWTFWGTIENFHEGWYHRSLLANLGMLLVQYLAIPIVLTVLTLVALRWRRVGLAAFVAVALFAAWMFAGASFDVTYVWIVLPLTGMGLLFFFGHPEPLRWARRLVIGLPLLLVLGFGIPNALRVAQRVDDGDYGLQRIAGNGIELVWAPEGPGWPVDGGVDHAEAVRRCRHLSVDGSRLEDTPQDVWRLPTVEELVRSQVHHGANAGGVWDAEAEEPRYELAPDKETPLWRTHSPVIYLWTSTEIDEQEAWIVVYHGGVFAKPKRNAGASFGFRAVRAPRPTDPQAR